MKHLRLLFSLAFTFMGLSSPCILRAQTNASTPPAPSVVVRHGNSGEILKDLKNAPPAVVALVLSFDAERDKLLMEQALLLEKLSAATTPQERATIREQLQANRQSFLDELADFRLKLKDELQNLAGRVSSAEMLRIIDAAKAASSAPGHDRRGH